MLLKDKVAIVTGGGSGIGRATAEALAREGAHIVIGNRNTERGQVAVQAIRAVGGSAIFQRTDVTRDADVIALVKCAFSEFGRLDLAFNNAGVEGGSALLADIEESEVHSILDVNVMGMWRCMKHEIRQMLAGGGGAIVNMSSIFGLRGFSKMSIYSASKHAVAGLTKVAAIEYAQRGIRVNAVAPGPIETEMLGRIAGGDPNVFGAVTPMQRIGTPAEVAGAVVWLCSDAASYVTGQIIPIDGGYIT